MKNKKILFLCFFLLRLAYSREEANQGFQHKKKLILVIGTGVFGGSLFFYSPKKKNNLFNPFCPEVIRTIEKKDFLISVANSFISMAVACFFLKPCFHTKKTHAKIKECFNTIFRHTSDRQPQYLKHYDQIEGVEHFLSSLMKLVTKFSDKETFNEEDYNFIKGARAELKKFGEENKNIVFKVTGWDSRVLRGYLLVERIEYLGKHYKKECIDEGAYP